jgi:hypothetical protein
MTEIQIRDKRTKKRFFVDNVFLDGYGNKLGPYGIAVYITLCRYANLDEQTCYPSVRTIAERTGMSENKARDCTRELEKLGLISIQTRYRNGSPTSNLYTILDPPASEETAESPQRGGGVPHSVEGGTPQRGGGVPHSVEGGTPQRGGEQSVEEQSVEEQSSSINPERADAGFSEDDLNFQQKNGFEALRDFGVYESTARELARLRSEKLILDWIEHARAESGLHNPPAFVVAKLRDGEEPPKVSGSNGRDEYSSADLKRGDPNAFERARLSEEERKRLAELTQ